MPLMTTCFCCPSMMSWPGSISLSCWGGTEPVCHHIEPGVEPCRCQKLMQAFALLQHRQRLISQLFLFCTECAASLTPTHHYPPGNHQPCLSLNNHCIGFALHFYTRMHVLLLSVYMRACNNNPSACDRKFVCVYGHVLALTQLFSYFAASPSTTHADASPQSRVPAEPPTVDTLHACC